MSPTITDGWTTLIDGLQIHRYYLQVQPARDRQLERCHELARQRADAALLPPLPELVARFGEGRLEHLLHPANHGGLKLLSDSTSSAGAPAPTAQGLAVVVDVATCIPADEVPIVPVDTAATVPAGAGAWPAGTEEAVRSVFRRAGLDYLLALCAEVVVLTGDRHASEAFRTPDIPGCTPWSTVLVRTGGSPVRQAALLADAAARRMLSCFARAGGAGRSGERLLSPVSGTVRPVTTVAAEIAGVAAEWRLLDTVVGGGGRGEGTTGWAEERLAALVALLPECVDALKAVEEGLAEPNTYDLVAGLLPGEHRFVRYREGGGLGQH